MQKSERLWAILQALFVTVLWSVSWVLIKISLKDIPPLTFAGLRYTLAVFVLLPGLYKHKAHLRVLSQKDWLQLIILGLVFYTLTQGGQFLTLNYLEAVTFSLLLNFTSIIVAIIGIIVLNEIPSPRQWAGILIFIAGVAVYFYPSISLRENDLGFVFAGITVSANAASSLLGRSINRQKTIPPTVVTVVSMGIGALVLLGAGLAVEEFPALDPGNIAVIVVLGVVNTALAFTLWNRSLQILSAVESSIINNTMLIQIALLAWAFLGERLSSGDIIGLVLAAVGILLANLKSK
jgi:drug/metabolite transporter (DMT)-like permease